MNYVRGGLPFYPSLAHLADYVESLPANGSADHKEYEWSLGADTAEALRLAREGWPLGAKLASEKATAIADRIVGAHSLAQTFVTGYDVMGAAYDAGAVALGMPEAWGVLNAEESKRAIRIVLSLTASGGIGAEVMQRRGIAVAALALVFVAKGYPVTIDAMIGSAGADNKAEQLIEARSFVRLADASTGSQLDLDRIAFGLGHPAIYRKLFAAAQCGHRFSYSGSYWGCGTIHNNIAPLDSYDLLFGGMHLRDVERWQDGGEKWILQEYLKQTGA